MQLASTAVAAGASAAGAATAAVQKRTGLGKKVKPITKNIPVEVLSAEMQPRTPGRLKRQQSKMRAEVLEAVKQRGGHAAGEKQTTRERYRRLVLSLKWQLFLLLTALIDVGPARLERGMRRSLPTARAFDAPLARC